MKKFGLIGNPIKTSGSPALFEAGYKGKYPYDLIEGDDFEASYRKFLEEYTGVNVTAPFKTDAFGKADMKSGICSKTGAANLLLKTQEGIYAANTDFSGVVLSILDAMITEGGYGFFSLYGEDYSTIKDILPLLYGHRPKAMIAGCGGAGRAAAAAAAEMGYETVLVNRSVAKAEKAADDMPEYGFRTSGIDGFPGHFMDSDLIVYTIPERIDAIEELDERFFRSPGKIVLEANYRKPSFGQKEQALMNANGCRYVSGRRWLLYQALTGFRIFTGETPDFDKMSRTI